MTPHPQEIPQTLTPVESPDYPRMEGAEAENAPWTRQRWQVLPIVSLHKLARLLALLMVSLSGMGIWDSGRFGLTLRTGVGLWCAIG